MSTTYIQSHIARTSRNLLVVNGVILLLLALFTTFLVVGNAALRKSQNDANARINAINGSDVLGDNSAVDLSHPTPLSNGEINEARLSELEGQVVTLSASQAVNTMFPVALWDKRATGKKKPLQPPTYFVYQTSAANPAAGSAPGAPPPGMNLPGMINPIGGPAFVIIPANYILPTQRNLPAFTGIIRSLQDTDRKTVVGLLQGHGVQTLPLPYVLDCLNIGATRAPVAPTNPFPATGGIGLPPLFLVLFVGLLGLSIWNVAKGIRRLKNPLLHPLYANLARYGKPADIERHIEADYQRGVHSLPPADITSSWVLARSFWTLDAVPLNYIMWIYRPNKVRFGRAMLLRSIVAAHTLVMLDRLGKQHAMRAENGQLNQIMVAITQGRQWMETGENSPVRRQFGMDKAGFIAAIEARRQQMTAQPTQYSPPPTQPTWVGPTNP